MPFQSEAQRRWMHINQPELAKRWEALEASGEYTPRKKVIKKRMDRRKKDGRNT